MRARLWLCAAVVVGLLGMACGASSSGSGAVLDGGGGSDRGGVPDGGGVDAVGDLTVPVDRSSLDGPRDVVQLTDIVAAGDVGTPDVVGLADGGSGDAGGMSSDLPGDLASTSSMSFFVTSRGMGQGGNLGGLAGADGHCRMLASGAGSTKTQWFAYLSVEDDGSGSPVQARDRIGSGPWVNARGVLIASDLDQLHRNAGMDNALGLENSLDEQGQIVPGRDINTRPPGTSNEHDIITGSSVDGTVLAGLTCANWTSSATTDSAQVGHSDKDGPNGRIQWNSAHETGGCAEGRVSGGIGSGGGSGRFYCFAAD